MGGVCVARLLTARCIIEFIDYPIWFHYGDSGLMVSSIRTLRTMFAHTGNNLPITSETPGCFCIPPRLSVFLCHRCYTAGFDTRILIASSSPSCIEYSCISILISRVGSIPFRPEGGIAGMVGGRTSARRSMRNRVSGSEIWCLVRTAEVMLSRFVKLPTECANYTAGFVYTKVRMKIGCCHQEPNIQQMYCKRSRTRAQDQVS